jgi:hypothetical protein
MSTPGDARPRILVAPGPQGPVASWHYHCEGCGAQASGASRDHILEEARRHNRDVHEDAGHVDVVRVGEV